MTTSAVTPLRIPSPPVRRKSIAKPALWIAIGLAAISVLIFTEYPIIYHPDAYTRRLINDRFFLVPHAAAALIAMLLGPFLFSTRFRTRHFKRHRIMGRVYVICIAIAAPIAFYLEFRATDVIMQFANGVLSTVWFLCTLAAFLTARNRQLTAPPPVDDPLLRLHPELPHHPRPPIPSRATSTCLRPPSPSTSSSSPSAISSSPTSTSTGANSPPTAKHRPS